jgi:hypothetical protein
MDECDLKKQDEKPGIETTSVASVSGFCISAVQMSARKVLYSCAFLCRDKKAIKLLNTVDTIRSICDGAEVKKLTVQGTTAQNDRESAEEFLEECLTEGNSDES